MANLPVILQPSTGKLELEPNFPHEVYLYNPPADDLIVIDDRGGNLYYSTDEFATYSTRSYTSGLRGIGFNNGKNVLTYYSGTGYADATLYFSLDYGATWDSEALDTIGGYHVAMSDDGQVIIIGGHTAGSVKHKYTNDYGATWQYVPDANYYGGGTYGGVYSWCNKDGSAARFAARSSGHIYTSNLTNATPTFSLDNTAPTHLANGLGSGYAHEDSWIHGQTSFAKGLLDDISGGYTDTELLFEDNYQAPIILSNGDRYYGSDTNVYKIAGGGSTRVSVLGIRSNGFCVDSSDNYIWQLWTTPFTIYYNGVAVTGSITMGRADQNLYITRGGTIFAISSGYILRKSTDGGDNWTQITTGPTLNANCFFGPRYRSD